MPDASRSFHCPHCASPLAFLRNSRRDLFCRSCMSAVAIVNGDEALWQGPSGQVYWCTAESLRSSAPNAGITS